MFYSITDLSKEISVSRATIINWINAKKIKAVRFGNIYRITKEEFDRIKTFGVSDNQDCIPIEQPLSKKKRKHNTNEGRRPWEK